MNEDISYILWLTRDFSMPLDINEKITSVGSTIFKVNRNKDLLSEMSQGLQIFRGSNCLKIITQD
jgi:hypothetical protein